MLTNFLFATSDPLAHALGVGLAFGIAELIYLAIKTLRRGQKSGTNEAKRPSLGTKND